MAQLGTAVEPSPVAGGVAPTASLVLCEKLQCSGDPAAGFLAGRWRPCAYYCGGFSVCLPQRENTRKVTAAAIRFDARDSFAAH